MTNGEAFRQMFPDVEVQEYIEPLGVKHGLIVMIHTGKHSFFDLWFPRSWWDAKYKGGKDDERNNIL